MRIIKKAIGIIQPHIVMVFSVLLFLSFAMVGLAFNIAINEYIKSGAESALNEARAVYEGYDINEASMIMRALGGNHRFMHSNVDVFAVRGTYEIYEPFHDITEIPYSVHAPMISEFLAERQVSLVLTNVRRLRADNHTFYVSVLPRSSGALIFYLDVTDILTFTTVVNRLLLVSVAMIWLISMIIANVFADSIMRPLRVLRNFVRQIGRGDFSENTHLFISEEFNELNQSLNHTARQLARYDNEQKTFFQNVSHELRTPLMSIKSYAEGIKHGIMNPEEASETILKATKRLTTMVDDILYVSRIDSVTAPIMDNVNLRAIVEERIAGQKPVAEERGLEIEIISGGEPIFVICAGTYIERVIDNLISNAIRYAKSVITVECYALGGNVTVRVSDDGPGFEPNVLPHVFERFYRGKNGLSGIGLSTVKAITDQHKGFATAENSEKGAVLTISIPRKRG